MRLFRLAFAVAVALLPWPIKNFLYRRLYGYQIGRGVRIGFSPFVQVSRCTIEDRARIGSLNFFDRIGDLRIGAHVRVGPLNLFRGGERVVLGSYVTVLRLNVFNAIIEGDFVEPVTSSLQLGCGVFVSTGHWFDFSDGIDIGAHSIVGGRHSSFWTHNRQRSRSIIIGCHTYLGSEVRAAPGVQVPPLSIVALGSVLTGSYGQSRVLIGGNPATVVRELNSRDLFLVVRKTRNDIPDTVARALLPEDLQTLAQCPATELPPSD